MTEEGNTESTENGFVPLDHIPIDTEATLEQLTANFQGVRSGLPELVKNSSDAYTRRGVENKEERQIVVLLKDGDTKNPSRLAVLDFAGASLEDFEGEEGTDYDGWCKWSSRTASRKEISPLIEGGHGNGGKSFMARGCKEESSLTSSYNNMLNKMGFRHKDGYNIYHPGWFTRESKKMRNLPDATPRESLRDALSYYRLEPEDLHYPIFQVLLRRNTWTLAELVGIKYTGDPEGKHWTTGYVKTVIEILGSHAQTNFAIESSSIWVYHNDHLSNAESLSKEEIEAMPGFKERIFSIPEKLIHPTTNNMISTTSEDGQTGILVLKTSKKNLRTGGKNRALNIIRFRNKRNVVAIQHISKYTISSGGNYIFGEVTLHSLTSEHLDGTNRQYLAETPLTEALENWVAEQIESLAQEIQKKFKSKDNILEKRETDNRLAEFRELMRQFLQLDIRGTDRYSQDGESSTSRKILRKRKGYGLILAEIDLEDGKDSLNIPIGVNIPIKYSCTDEEGRPVTNVIIAWHCENKGIADIDPDEGIFGISEGTTEFWVEDTFTGITSNKVKANVKDIKSVDLEGPSEPVKQGQRIKIKAIAKDIHGEVIPNIALRYIPDPIESATVGRMGYFTAGEYEGEVEISAKYGKEDKDITKIIINILGERMTRPGAPGRDDFSIPFIVLCGREAPGCSDLPKEQRTYYPQETEPTILDDHPMWRPRGIIWINPESAESRRILQRGGGTVPRMRMSSKTYTEFLALKCFEILRRLKALQNLEGMTSVEPDLVITELNSAEIDCADFIELAFNLIDSWNI